MDYLRTLGSAAVSTLVQKSGLNLPFALGPKVAALDGVCTLYDATKRDDGLNVSVFEYDFSQKKDWAPFAKNALRKLRTIRHPDVLKFMDTVESDTSIYIMTERVRPLQVALQSWASKKASERQDWLLWGLHRIAVALAFVNDSVASTHGSIRINSIFISVSGEWKLGGFELLSNPTDPTSILWTLGGLMPQSAAWAPPEAKSNGWSSLKQADPAAADSYAYGLLINAVFNPNHHPPDTASPPHPPPPASARRDIPTTVFQVYKKLLNPNAKGRMSVSSFLKVGMADDGFFAGNHLVKVCHGLDGFAVGSEAEKASVVRMLNESMDSFPTEFATQRVLPSLVSALDFGGVSAASILPLILRLGNNVPDSDYSNVILAPLVKLYASPDRGTRMALLDHLPDYVDKLDKKTVDNKIFTNFQTGFSDTVAVIREATVKAVILLAPKLSDRNLNNELLRHLARLQSDPEASIRTNTCILIGRLGPTLGYHTKRKVLVPAFTRAIKDSFVHARVAGLMAFMATIDCFEIEDLASKVVPNISSAMLDKEKLVRDQAFKAVEFLVKKIEAHAATMPQTALSETGEPLNAILPGGFPNSQGALVNSAAGAAGALAGWAISSLGKRLAASDMQSTMNTAIAQSSDIGRPTSAPPPSGLDSRIGNLRPSPLVTSISAANSTASTPTFTNHSSTLKSKGLQLGANKVPANVLSEVLADEWATQEALALGDSNPWGSDDLMDVNADAEDWSAFETAPVVAAPQPVSAARPAIDNNHIQPLTIQSQDAWGHNLSSSSFLSTSQPQKPPSAPARSPLQVKTKPAPPKSSGWDDVGGWDDAEATKPTASSNGPTSTPLTPSLTEEEKAAEMARRKEERKQRIALLKEQKKTTMK